jgi:hypothetical protein
VTIGTALRTTGDRSIEKIGSAHEQYEAGGPLGLLWDNEDSDTVMNDHCTRVI